MKKDNIIKKLLLWLGILVSPLLKGFAIHCHHDILAEYCWDYAERVESIKKDKPQNEQETRLRLFKILPKEALLELPLKYQKADEARPWQETYKARQEADKAWPQESKDAFHKKWCVPDCPWDGKRLVFEK